MTSSTNTTYASMSQIEGPVPVATGFRLFISEHESPFIRQSSPFSLQQRDSSALKPCFPWRGEKLLEAKQRGHSGAGRTCLEGVMGGRDVPRKKAASRDLYICRSPRWGYREAHSRAACDTP